MAVFRSRRVALWAGIPFKNTKTNRDNAVMKYRGWHIAISLHM